MVARRAAQKPAAKGPQGRKRTTLDEQVAYHEAGHAVTHHALGHGVSWVAIFHETAKRRGGTKSRQRPAGIGDRTPAGQRRMMGWAIVAMAGREAQRLHHGRRHRLQPFSADSVSVEEYVGAIARARLGVRSVVYMASKESGAQVWPREYPGEFRRWHALLEKRTAHLLKRCWPMVDAVARALLVERKLAGTRLGRVIREATPKRVDVRALRAAATEVKA